MSKLEEAKAKLEILKMEEEILKLEMDLVIDGNKLLRSRSYFGPDDGTTYQTMFHIDPDCVEFHTAYDGTRYREEIRFLDDNTRLRQTVGWNQETNEIELCGQYFEERIF